MTLSEVDAFFQKHPLHDSYFKALNDERAGTLAVAERDVLAAVNIVRSPPIRSALFSLPPLKNRPFFCFSIPNILPAFTPILKVWVPPGKAAVFPLQLHRWASGQRH